EALAIVAGLPRVRAADETPARSAEPGGQPAGEDGRRADAGVRDALLRQGPGVLRWDRRDVALASERREQILRAFLGPGDLPTRFAVAARYDVEPGRFRA